MTTTPWLVTREQVRAAVPAVESAAYDARIDDACASATESVQALCLRVFYPTVATKYLDWPNNQRAESWRIWLDMPDQLISLDSVTSGGTSISTGDVLLEPANFGPPYTRIEIDRSAGSIGWTSGDTPQRAIAMTGLWGYRNNTASAGALAEALDEPETDVDVTGAAAVALGVGSLLACESERMVVTGRSWLTTGQTIQTTSLTATNSDVTVNVTSSAGFARREIILIDSEKMEILDIVGNALMVRRAYGGTVLAAHSTGTTIYGSRTLTVERGALGTTAASHLTSTALTRWVPPALAFQLALAEAQTELAQTAAAYARTTGGEVQREISGKGIADLRKRCERTHGRRARVAAI